MWLSKPSTWRTDRVVGMGHETNKILIKIGKNFEANATGTISVLLLFAVVLILAVIGYSFI